MANHGWQNVEPWSRIGIVWVKQYHTQPFNSGNGKHTSYKNGDGWGMVYEIVFVASSSDFSGQTAPGCFSLVVSEWAQVPKFCCFLLGRKKVYKSLWPDVNAFPETAARSWQAEGELHLSSLRCICCRFLGLMTVSPRILCPCRLWRKSEPVEVGKTYLQRGVYDFVA